MVHAIAHMHTNKNGIPQQSSLFKCLYIRRLNLKTEGSTEFITRRPLAVAPEGSEGATKGLRVINYIDHVGFEV